MRMLRGFVALTGLLVGTAAAADEVKDDFMGRLSKGWTWIREDPAAWRTSKTGALEIRVQPGNMWGPANDARNVLVRPVAAAGGTVEVSVTASNQPTHQYEQINLVWYYDDANMVKLGLEQVDGVLSLVMGREEADRTTTVAKLAVKAHTLDLRFIVTSDTLRGQFRPGGEKTWTDAGTCTLPVRGDPKISLQVYKGPPDADRWARFQAFRMVRRPAPPSAR